MPLEPNFKICRLCPNLSIYADLADGVHTYMCCARASVPFQQMGYVDGYTGKPIQCLFTVPQECPFILEHEPCL